MLDNEFPPLGGGTATVNYFLLRELAADQDLWIDLVTSSRTRATIEQEQFSPRIRIFKVPVNNKNIHHSTAQELLRYTARGWRKCVELVPTQYYDFSFAFSGLPAGFISLLLKRRYHLPYLVSLQGPDIPGFEIRYRHLYPFLAPIIRSIWRGASAVIAISKQHRELALRCAPKAAIDIIPNGLDLALFPWQEEPPLRQGLVILCVARLIKRKGQEHLIKAFAALKQNLPGQNLRLRFVGTGDAEESLRRLCRSLGISGSVEFRGYVDRESMPEIYRDAHIFVLPSQHEGMSIALLEALATGLPAVVTNVGGTDELIQHEGNGLIFDYGDIATMTSHLARLTGDAGLRTSMRGTNKQIIGNFSWAKIADDYRLLFRRIVPEKTST